MAAQMRHQLRPVWLRNQLQRFCGFHSELPEGISSHRGGESRLRDDHQHASDDHQGTIRTNSVAD